MEKQLLIVMIADIFGYSRLSQLDEFKVVDRQLAYSRDFIYPTIKEFNGTLIKNTGDGFLAIFNVAQSAMNCALKIQKEIPLMETPFEEELKIKYRIGLNVGDVLKTDEDVFGNVVNISARIEGICIPGGICVSSALRDVLENYEEFHFKDIGLHKVKNIKNPLRVFQSELNLEAPAAEELDNGIHQNIKFCMSNNDVQIAYSIIGKGIPILKAPNWLNHIEYEIRSPLWAPLLKSFSEQYQLIRFDQRGTGLSDWDPPEISEDAMIEDMKSVVNASNIKKFGIYGLSQGCAFAIRYAVENPEQVKFLILFGGYILGRTKRNSEADKNQHEIGVKMIEAGWGSNSQIYRNFFTNSFIPDGLKEEINSFDELQRVSTNSSNAVRIHNMNGNVDVTEYAKLISVPTLVLHCEGDQVNPLKEGRRMASAIPNAYFKTLKGNNHVLLSGTPEYLEFFSEVNNFIKEIT